jgi:hypothetical protein
MIQLKELVTRWTNTKYSGLLIDMFLNDDAKFSNFKLKINTNNVQKKCSCIKYTHLSSHQSKIYSFNASIQNEDIKKVKY